ncbi:MAG: hypothetical protein U0575_01060 [Phycisphaerales bacterium]
MTRLSTLAASIAAISTAASVHAADVFNLAQWTFGNFADGYPSPQATVGTVIPILGPSPIFGTGSVTPTLMTMSSGNAGKKGITRFAATALTAGTVTFTWTYQSFDMPCYDNGGYFINNLFTVIACNGGGPFGGTTSFVVNAGDTFGFGARTGDGLESSGTLKVSAFQFSGVMGPPALGDLDGDGFVNGADLGLLIGAWGQPDGAADLDGNGVVDAADLGLLLANWT